jgi:hypothetical protein
MRYVRSPPLPSPELLICPSASSVRAVGVGDSRVAETAATATLDRSIGELFVRVGGKVQTGVLLLAHNKVGGGRTDGRRAARRVVVRKTRCCGGELEGRDVDASEMSLVVLRLEVRGGRIEGAVRVDGRGVGVEGGDGEKRHVRREWRADGPESRSSAKSTEGERVISNTRSDILLAALGR